MSTIAKRSSTTQIISDRRPAVKVTLDKHLQCQLQSHADALNDCLWQLDQDLRRLSRGAFARLFKRMKTGTFTDKAIALRWAPAQPLAIVIIEGRFDAEFERRNKLGPS